jgi:galactokinase
VHGGGFAGTIQSFVPLNLLDEYKKTMESVFGENHCYSLKIRPVGGTKVSKEM